MKIITTPMCEDILKIANVNEYNVVKATDITNADLVITLSETKVNMPKISVKLNTYTQLLNSINDVCEQLNTQPQQEKINEINLLIEENKEKKVNRKNIKVKVYSNFLLDTVEDMGFSISDDYEYIIIPDYMKENFSEDEKVIIIPSHKNVSSTIITRIKERYQILESKLCTKQ